MEGFNWSIVGWIVGLLFVYFFGLYEGRGQGYKRRKAEEALEKKDAPEPPPVTVNVDDPGLLRVKNENGQLTLDLDGSRVNTAVLNMEQRKRLVEILTLIRPWLEGKPVSMPATPQSAPPAQPKPGPVIAAPSAVEPAPTVPPPTTAATPNIIAKDDRPAAPAGSIVSQIDSILQAHLATSPLFNRGIFLSQSPEGGVIVHVGMAKYMGVDEVPDAEVKALLRGAIKEWENKYTPGL